MKGGLTIKDKIRSDSFAIEMLIHLSAVRMIWKKDLMLYARKNVDRKTAALAYQVLLQREFVQENKSVSDLKTVSLTSKGMRYLADHNFPADIKRDYASPFRTEDPEKIHKELTKVKAVTLFRSAGVASIPCEKPSLGQLLNSYIPMFEVEENAAARYLNQTRDEIQRQLSGSGYYYRSDEFRSFLNAQGEAMADTIKGSRFTGIYLSRNECCIVYSADPGDNRMLRISMLLEQRLTDLLEKYLNASLEFNVFRTVSGTAHRINAIVISDGNALVYEMVMGNKSGHIKGKSAPDKEYEISRRTRNRPKSQILRFDQEIFGKVFLIPANTNGSDSLRFLAEHDTEHWISEGTSLCRRFESLREAGVPDTKIQGICRSTGMPVIYMPVYELMSLYEASVPDHANNPSHGFLAPAWMHKTIKHCVRLDIPLYDSETGESDRTVIRYQRNGYPEGKHAPRKPTSNKFKRQRTSISCSREVHALITAAAREAGVSVSSYFVRAAIEKVRSNKPDERKDHLPDQVNEW